MAGTKQFDEVAVDRALMETFWRLGFGHTRIDALEEATGLKRGSLYNAFGGKEAMYARAITEYGDRVEERLLDALDAHDEIVPAIRAMFDRQIEAMTAPTAPPGCFLSAAASEIGALSPDLGDLVRRRMQRSETRLHARLQRAQQAGQLAPDRTIRPLARYLLSLLRALPLMHRVTADRRFVEEVAQTALIALETDGPGGRNHPQA